MGRRGISLIEVILSIGVIVMLFGGVYAGYVSIQDVITNSELRAAAAAALHREIEIIRNLPYASVGTVGGVPSGVIPQTKSVTSTITGVTFSIAATVRNIDDPFDGVINGTPSDTAPADYKLIELRISCTTCTRFLPLSLTTTVAPKSLESASNQGSLFVNVFDATAIGVSGATVHVVNASVTPAIDLTDTTNASGVLQLVGVPTSTQGYRIEVNKAGYSSDRTYPPNNPANPNPILPDATVVAQSLTTASFAIDRVSTITVKTQDHVCAPIASRNFSLDGGKLIGTSPDVLKFATSSITNSSGTKIMANIEWDTYMLTLNDANYDLVGTIPLSPMTVNPSSSVEFSFIVQPSSSVSLLVTVKDSGGGPLSSSSVNLSKTGFSETLITGHSFLTYTDWALNQYASQDGGIEADAVPGKLTLKQIEGVYSTTTTSWLISNTIDLGGASSTLYTLSWNPASQPPQTGSGSLTFQLASNNDQVTWNFVGPDGTSATYYTASATIAAAHTNNRYVRYKAYLRTQNENYTPELQDIRIEFTGVCVPQSQVLFTNLPVNTYTLTASRAGYTTATSSVTVGAGWNQTQILLTPQ